VNYLMQMGATLRAYSRSPEPGDLPLAQLPQDLRQGKVDIVLHLAWSVVPAEAELDPWGQWQVDLPQLGDLLDVLSERNSHGQNPVRLVFFSSGSVYGEGDSRLSSFDENCPRNPKGYYAKAKAAAEDMILSHIRQGLKATILRITNPYGFPQEDGRLQGVIPALCHAALQRKTFTLWGDGSAIKDYVYFEDLCVAVKKVLGLQLTGVYNLSSGESIALLDLVKMVQEITGISLAVRHSPHQKWDVQHGRYSSQKLRTAIGWVPSLSLREGLLRTWIDWGSKLGPSK